MIPVRLEIEGLYSYKEKQIVDFEQLTAAGLFGIFGAVGSGKSSILEAILLALYGSTERLSDRGEKTSMVNLQKDNLMISFEFKCGQNNTCTYLARYSARRNPKNFDEIRPAEHLFYEKIADKYSPINQRAEELLGMKKEHFKQTVIIPQGKFRDFIDLTPGPRADMMKELFGLERFDLAAKTGILLRKVKDQKIKLETLILTLESISESSLKEKEQECKILAHQVEVMEANFSATSAAFSAQESLLIKFNQLKTFEQEWKDLQQKLPEIEAKKNQWKDFLKAKTHLKPVYEQIGETEVELEKFSVSVIDCTRFKESISAEVVQLEKEEEELKAKSEKRPEREAKIRDLKKVLEIQELNIKLQDAKAKAALNLPQIEDSRKSLREQSEAIRKLEEELEALKIPDVAHLAELKTAITDWEQLETQLQGIAAQLEKLQLNEQEQKSKIHELQLQLPKENQEIWTAKQRSHIKELEAKKDKLLHGQGLIAHVHLLEDGEPCPLCGSKEHPSPLSGDTEEGLIQQLGQKITLARQTLEFTTALYGQSNEQLIRQTHNLQILAEKQDEQKTLQAKLNLKKKVLEEMDIKSIDSLRVKIADAEKQLKYKDHLFEKLKVMRGVKETLFTKIEAEETAQREAEQQQLNLLSTLSAKKDEIKDHDFTSTFYEKPIEVIRQSIEKVKLDIEETAFKLTGKQKSLLEKRANQATNLANLRNFEKALLETRAKLEKLNQTFLSLRQIHGFNDLQALIELIHHSLDADKVDAEVRQYEDRRLLVESKIQELKHEKGIETFSKEAFDATRINLEKIKSELEATKTAFTLLDQQIRELHVKLKEKQHLEVELAEIHLREANLKEMEILFRGSGFVRYVSTIYLKELCNTANVRFMKLTKNSLSLDIDDHNTFWIIDYLNGGKKRLLKTLSGGQTFQASLCLALALAEKVKSLNQADQSFFFLDEGFGALDRDSLRVVFETLKSLRHENRIVGIISHVEELQQEIGVYAQIELNSELGSQVKYSFS
jgi:DNA repair protein SbcC/Rad50